MNPSHFGDAHDIAKVTVMGWLAPCEEWSVHPMYYVAPGDPWDTDFPCQFAYYLGAHLVVGNLCLRHELVDIVKRHKGHVFLDPDKGLKLDGSLPKRRADNGPRQHLNVVELGAVATHEPRRSSLVLVYDHSIDRNYCGAGTPDQQIGAKLLRIRGMGVHAAAYVAYHQRVSFIWASVDCGLVTAATRRMVAASRLPDCCFVDDGCGHV